MTNSEVESFCPKNRYEWREWLVQNHESKQAVWLVYYKKKTNVPSVIYSDAVDEALCFGWIDSKAKSMDDQLLMQFFCKRKAKSVWSKVNKVKVQRLIEAELMTQAGFESIETAKKNGYWAILDDAEALVVPPALASEFENNPNAKAYFEGLSRTDKRNILQWLTLAKRPETQQKRIIEIIILANQNQKPKQFR